MGSVIKKRRKRMAKKKHRKLLKKTRVQRRKHGKQSRATARDTGPRRWRTTQHDVDSSRGNRTRTWARSSW